jgi:DNA invertase Pin-like site-specific DNA recombinase
MRVSGKGQLRGDIFVRQQLAIEAYAKRNGITIVKTLKERAVPGPQSLRTLRH